MRTILALQARAVAREEELRGSEGKAQASHTKKTPAHANERPRECGLQGVRRKIRRSGARTRQ